MELIEELEPASVAAPHDKRPLPYFRMTAAVLLLAALLAVFSTAGSEWGSPPFSGSSLLPNFRYVNSGWIAPLDSQDAGPFSQELRAFVIVSQEELEAFESTYISKAVRGNPTSLGRIDFDTSVLLAAYYLWRPVQGDPLSVSNVSVKGDRAQVQLELDKNAQGREYAYLYAPMTMVAVERPLFPEGEPVEFVFELAEHSHNNAERHAQLSAAFPFEATVSWFPPYAGRA